MIFCAPKKRLAWLVLSFATLAISQVAAPKTRFWDHAIVKQKDGSVIVDANSPRPMDQALEAIAEQYGWVIDYEDPPYGSSDLVDDTDPAWRKAHPAEKGVTRVAGSMFRAEFSVDGDMVAGSPDEERVLDKVVADYEASGNPGDFVLKKEGVAGRYAVVGVAARDGNGNSRRYDPILDTRVTLSPEERSVGSTLDLIARLVSEKSGRLMDPGQAPINLVTQTRAKIGGDEQAARDLLAQLASETRLLMRWRLLYDADWKGGTYFLNLEIATQTTKDGSGEAPLKSGAWPRP
jgi:hypothetical protein